MYFYILLYRQCVQQHSSSIHVRWLFLWAAEGEAAKTGSQTFVYKILEMPRTYTVH